MKKPRIIARLDVKGPNVIKGIHLECLRAVGKPGEMAAEYFLQGADELIYLDIVANLYRRQNLLNIVNEASDNIFIPFTVGGGVRTIEDIRALLEAGADKVAINTAATKNPELIREASKMFGSQCIVISIEAIKKGPGRWEAYTDNGREQTGLDVLEWVKQVEKLGAGEILLTSIDMEGTEQGFDIELVKKVSDAVSIPVIASGGAGKIEDFVDCIKKGNADAVATASLLHYKKYGVSEIKEGIIKHGIELRHLPNTKKIDVNQNEEDLTKDHNRYTFKQMKDSKLYDEIGHDKQFGFVDGDGTDKKIRKDDGDEDYDIGIINCGINNVKSVLRAFQQIGKKARRVRTPEEVIKAKALILPGVGSFENGMKALEVRGLIEPIKEKVQQGTPILGICLGMQLLFSEGEEFGVHKGLDLIKGRVVSLKSPHELNMNGYRLPHIGWNRLLTPSFSNSIPVGGTFLKNFIGINDFYFVHSFYPVPEDKNFVLATTKYGGQEFCVVAKKDNIYATQFHPEKSGPAGLEMLKAFCEENKI